MLTETAVLFQDKAFDSQSYLRAREEKGKWKEGKVMGSKMHAPSPL